MDAGQPLFESDTNKLYIGDGTTEVKSLKPVVAEKLVCPKGEISPETGIKPYLSIDDSGLTTNVATIKLDDGSLGFYLSDGAKKRWIVPGAMMASGEIDDSNLLIVKNDICKTKNIYTETQIHNARLYIGDGSKTDTGMVYGYENGIHITSIHVGGSGDATANSMIDLRGSEANSGGNLQLSTTPTAQTIQATGDLNLQAHKILTMAAVNDLSVISNGGNIAINAGTTSTGKLLQLQSTTGSPTVVTVTPVTIGSTYMATTGEQFTIVPKTRTPQYEMLSLGFCQDSTSSDLYPVIRYNDAIGNRMWLRFPDLGDDQEGTIATLENLPTIPHTKYLHRLDIYAYNSSYYVYAYMDIINDSSTAIGTIDAPKLAVAVLNNSVSGSIPCTGYINSKSSTSVYYPIVKFQASSGSYGTVVFGFLNSTKYDTVSIRTSLPSGTSITIKDNVIPFTV